MTLSHDDSTINTVLAIIIIRQHIRTFTGQAKTYVLTCQMMSFIIASNYLKHTETNEYW